MTQATATPAINTTVFLTAGTIEKIREILAAELLKRGVSAPLTTLEVKQQRDGAARLIMESAPFQTTPVMFKSVTVQNFGGDIFRDKKTEMLTVGIPVYFAWESFSRGTNGTEMFTAYIGISERDDDAWLTSMR